MSRHRRQEPVWTSERGADVKAGSPAERGRSAATRLDGGEHSRRLSLSGRGASSGTHLPVEIGPPWVASL